MSEQQLKDGVRAQQLLNDSMLADAFDSTKANILNGIATSAFDQADVREDAYHQLRALESVKGQLERHIRTAAGLQAQEKDAELRNVLRPVELAKEDQDG